MIDLQMARVPAGFFLRGENLQDAQEAHESPQLKVWVDEYEIQVDPVTVSQWSVFLEDSHYSWPKAEWIAECERTHAMPRILSDAPITFVSWHDCSAFAAWLSANSNRRYSLPTENQWEKACRGCEGGRYPWGNGERKWEEEFSKQSDAEGNFLLRPVGQSKDTISPFGCEDMWSLVQEWCDDWFLLDFANPKSPDNDPPGRYKVARGGNAIASGWPRCTARQRMEPDFRSYILGFRLVR
jgi:formylglycine-generating enzyme required for sulfatase activity